MRIFLRYAASFFLATVLSPAIAGPAADALGACMADNTTGKERKELAQWIFVTMSVHPDIKPFANVTEANREEFDKKLAALVTRLMTESCQKESKATIEAEGSAAFGAAFESVGRLAMNELMSNPAVAASFTRYVKHLDRAKFEAAFANK